MYPKRDHLIIGAVLSAVGCFPSTLLLLAGNLSPSLVPAIPLLAGAALIGAGVGYVAFRFHSSIWVTVLGSLLGPNAGSILATIVGFWLEEVLAQWGVIRIYDAYGYRVAPTPAVVGYLLLATLPIIVLVTSIAIAFGLGRIERIFRLGRRSNEGVAQSK